MAVSASSFFRGADRARGYVEDTRSVTVVPASQPQTLTLDDLPEVASLQMELPRVDRDSLEQARATLAASGTAVAEGDTADDSQPPGAVDPQRPAGAAQPEDPTDWEAVEQSLTATAATTAAADDSPSPVPDLAPAPEAAARPLPETTSVTVVTPFDSPPTSAGQPERQPALPARRMVTSTVAVPTAAAAATGWRGWWNRLFGRFLPLSATHAELLVRRAAAGRAALRAVSWPQQRSIVVANIKGGSCKTTAAALLAGLLAETRGPVAVFEACETRGTLDRRCEPGGAGITRLLDPARPPIKALQDLTPFLSSQPSRAMVLASPQPRPELTADAVTGIHDLLAGYFAVVIADTANNAWHPAWQAAVAAADVVVVPCWATPDSVAGALECLAVLAQHPDPRISDRESGLRSRTVVIAAQPPGGSSTGDVQPVLDAGVAHVVRVPFDPALAAGEQIDWTAVSPESHTAWTTAAAIVAAVSNGVIREALV